MAFEVRPERFAGILPEIWGARPWSPEVEAVESTSRLRAPGRRCWWLPASRWRFARSDALP